MSRPLVFLVLALAAQAAGAANVCRIVSGTGMAFGTYDLITAIPTDSVTTVVVECARNGGPQHVTVTLGLSQGTHGNSVGARRMRRSGGTDVLTYGLFRDVSRQNIWGYTTGVDASSQSIAFSVSNNSTASLIFTIYGRIPALQNVPAGDYGDTVQMTLTP